MSKEQEIIKVSQQALDLISQISQLWDESIEKYVKAR